MADRRSVKKTAEEPVIIRVRRRAGLLTPHAIRRLSRLIAERFQPERIILFGSYAWGQPHGDSDVDLLVVMPANDESAKAVRIRQAIWAQFPWDVIVRTPERIRRRLQWGDSFLREITTRGKVLYEKGNGGMGAQGGKGLRRGKIAAEE
jgi:predicted nucleotidyltransferase